MPQKTKEIVEKEGRQAITIAGDIGDKQFCEQAVQQTVEQLGRLDMLVNNAGEQHWDKDIADIDEHQLRRTFQTNIFGMFFMTQAARPHLKRRLGDHQHARRRRRTKARSCCSITARPRARSSASPARSPRTWSRTASA